MHFEVAQNLMMHLIQTKSKGLVFKSPKDKYLNHLPLREDIFVNENEIKSDFKCPKQQLTCYCDSSHAADHRAIKSNTGCAFFV